MRNDEVASRNGEAGDKARGRTNMHMRMLQHRQSDELGLTPNGPPSPIGT